MLEYYEVSPLPEVCIRCMSNGSENEDCYNCDYALDRWHLTPESEKHLSLLWNKNREKTNK